VNARDDARQPEDLPMVKPAAARCPLRSPHFLARSITQKTVSCCLDFGQMVGYRHARTRSAPLWRRPLRALFGGIGSPDRVIVASAGLKPVILKLRAGVAQRKLATPPFFMH
jgi:hypothetical protein